MKNAMIFLVLALLLAACAAPSTPAPAPTGTRTPTPIPSATLEPTLTLTPPPSRTPEPTLTPTLNFFFVLPSLTSTPQATPSRELDCRLLSQSITNGTEFHPKEPFSIDWKIKNTGSAGWGPGDVDFTYFGGTRMYQYQVVRLPIGVVPGNNVSLNVDMRAPNKSSLYTTLWSLRRGNDYFCRVRLTIYVH